MGFMPNRKPVIMMLLTHFWTQFPENIWRRSIQYARLRDINLIIKSVDISHDISRNRMEEDATISTLIPGAVDGVLVLSSLLDYANDSKIQQRIFSRLAPLPAVSFGMAYPGVPSVVTDNSSPMANLLHHLLKHHGCRSFWHIRGPAGTSEANERADAFNSAMVAWDIQENQCDLEESSFTFNSGYAAMQRLLARNPGLPDAIVCACDEMALGCIRALEERGYFIPTDVIVTGYDDLLYNRALSSGLTTIRQPIKQMIDQALDLLLECIDGVSVPPVTTVPSFLVVRTSCGCMEEQEATHAETIPQSICGWSDSLMETDRHNQKDHLNQIGDLIRQHAGVPEWASALRLLRKEMVSLLNKSDNPRMTLEKATEVLAATARNTLAHLEEGLHKNAALFVLDVQIMLNAVYNETTGRRRFGEERVTLLTVLDDIFRLVSSSSFDQLFGIAAEVLPKIGLKSFCIVLYKYDDPKKRFRISGENWISPEQGCLRLAVVDGIRLSDHEGTFFHPNAILPELPWGTATRQLAISPLAYHDEVYGYMVHDIGIQSAVLLEMVRRQLSSTIMVVHLIEALRKANSLLESFGQEQMEERKQLQETLDALKQTQAQLVQAEKLAALGSLVSGVAHEINTPLGIGISAASLIGRETRDLRELYLVNGLKRSTMEDYLDATQQACELLDANLKKSADLVKSFKQVSTDQAGEELRIFNLREYVDTVLLSTYPLLIKRDVSVSVDCAPDLLMRSYPGALSQILIHLIDNSINHAFPSEFKGVLHIRALRDGDDVLFDFTDNGIGIQPEHIDRIFDPFFTTNRSSGATGLGLNMVFNLVYTQLKGSISCQSVPGAGTTFHLRFPMKQEKS